MLEIARGIVRPVVTVALILAAIAFVAFGVAVPDWYTGLVGVVVAFWFASRQTKP